MGRAGWLGPVPVLLVEGHERAALLGERAGGGGQPWPPSLEVCRDRLARGLQEGLALPCRQIAGRGHGVRRPRAHEPEVRAADR